MGTERRKAPVCGVYFLCGVIRGLWNIDDFKILCIVGHGLSGPERALEVIFACRIILRGLDSLATCILPWVRYNLGTLKIRHTAPLNWYKLLLNIC